ncbi:MAG: hypothetical protein SGBAC_012205, partial [Bacillariaceae sp.]
MSPATNSKHHIRLSSSDFTPIALGDLTSPLVSNPSHEHNHEFQVRDDHDDDGNNTLAIDGLGKGNELRITGEMDGFGGQAILQEDSENGGDIVLEAILSEKCGMHFNYKLLSATPQFPDQKAYRKKIKGQKMYEHANVKRQNYFLDNYDIQYCSRPSSRGLEEEKEEEHVDYVVRGRDVGSLELEVYETDSHKRCGTIYQGEDSTWQVSSDNEEINPKLMACLTAIA